MAAAQIMTPEPTPLVTVLPCDRTAAWPFADFHCMPDVQMRERWFSGYYDTLSEGAAIRSMAAHRLAALEAAAKVAETFANGHPHGPAITPDRYRRDIAAAIRELSNGE